MVGRFIGIPGLGRSRAEAIYDAGYTNLGLLRKAPVEELTRVPGVGVSLARCIKNNISQVKEEVPAEITVVSPGTPAVGTQKDETGKAAAGGPASQPPAAGASAGGPSGSQVAAGGHPPAQSRGFLSSLFGKILGKPGEKGPENKPPEKKEEARPDAKPGEHDVKIEGKPAEHDVLVEGKPGEHDVKVEGKPGEPDVLVEGKPEAPKAESGAEAKPPEAPKAEAPPSA
jgi:hypothetical protein